jgi:hypothetical protein
MSAPPLVTEDSLCRLKKLLLDKLAVYARVKTRPSKIYPIPYFDTTEALNIVASSTIPMEHDSSDGKLHTTLMPL